MIVLDAGDLRGAGRVLEKAGDDQAADFRLGTIGAGVIKHVAHELADHDVFFLLPKGS